MSGYILYLPSISHAEKSWQGFCSTDCLQTHTFLFFMVLYVFKLKAPDHLFQPNIYIFYIKYVP